MQKYKRYYEKWCVEFGPTFQNDFCFSCGFIQNISCSPLPWCDLIGPLPEWLERAGCCFRTLCGGSVTEGQHFVRSVADHLLDTSCHGQKIFLITNSQFFYSSTSMWKRQHMDSVFWCRQPQRNRRLRDHRSYQSSVFWETVPQTNRHWRETCQQQCSLPNSQPSSIDKHVQWIRMRELTELRTVQRLQSPLLLSFKYVYVNNWLKKIFNRILPHISFSSRTNFVYCPGVLEGSHEWELSFHTFPLVFTLTRGRDIADVLATRRFACLIKILKV